jgi:hypothetical protein
MSAEPKEGAGGLEDFEFLLASAQTDDGDADLEALFKNAGDDREIPEGAFDALTSAEDFEKMLRDEWSLPRLDVSGEISRLDAMQRPDKGLHDDPFSSDDYTDEQWPLVLALKKPCLEAVAPETESKKRQAAITWIFSEGSKDRHGLSFEQACRALGARGFVIQALIQHFWCLRAIVLPEGLPYLSRPLSDVLESEATMSGMEPGMRMARVVWRFPSITESELFERCGITAESPDREEYVQALEWLCEAGLLARRIGRVYFTSRHPERRHRPNAMQGKVRGVSWSSSFVGDNDED